MDIAVYDPTAAARVAVGGTEGADAGVAAVHVVEQGNPVGLRNLGSETNPYLVAFGNYNATRLDIDATETLVTNAPCLVFGVVGNDGNTGYTDLIDASATGGGSVPKFRVNCGDGVNTQWLGGARFETGLCVDGESAGHDVTVLWRPI